MSTIAVAALHTLRLHGAMGAVYVSANAVSHPETLSYPLTHFASQPIEGHAGVAAGLLAIGAHLLLRRAGASGTGPGAGATS